MAENENDRPDQPRLATAAELMARRPSHVDVDVAAWDARVRLARLDGPAKLRAALAAEVLDQADREGLYTFGVDLLADSIVGEDGQRLFGNDESKRWLSGEIRAIGELMSHAMKLNGLEVETIAADVGAAEKNSEQVQVSVSSTDLDLLLDGQQESFPNS